MKTLISTLLLTLAFTVVSCADKPTGITVRGSKYSSLVAPITISVPGQSGLQHFSAVDADGNKWPVTLEDGEGVLIAPSSATDTTYTLKKAGKSKIEIKKGRKSERFNVFLGGDLFTSFHYTDEQVKPYLWPLLAHGDAPITRDWPMGDRNKSKDHPHHESFWTAYGDLNDADFWAFTDRKGTQDVNDVDVEPGAAYGTIRLNLTWHNKEGDPVVDEIREYKFYNTPSEARLFDVTTTLTAAHGDAKFVDTKEGGMVSLRMNDDLREVGGSGTITNSEGGVGAGETWGKAAAWCDYSGSLEGFGNVGITVMDHPTSFRYPTHWHVRDYGLMGANAFGYSYFYGKSDKTKNGDHLLKSGDSITFTYRIYVHAGDVNEAEVADQYALFTNPGSGVGK
ncbi:MAG: PmoA family protein [Candidatus Hydrogenedentota bacterium]